jgi:hypothetical protein
VSFSSAVNANTPQSLGRRCSSCRSAIHSARCEPAHISGVAGGYEGRRRVLFEMALQSKYAQENLYHRHQLPEHDLKVDTKRGSCSPTLPIANRSRCKRASDRIAWWQEQTRPGVINSFAGHLNGTRRQ